MGRQQQINSLKKYVLSKAQRVKPTNTVIKVCMGTGGIAAGGSEVMDAFRTELDASGIEATVEKNCLMHKVRMP